MIIWGFRGKVRPLANIRARCPRCGQEAAQRLVRSQRWFTLFFIPIFPFRTRYIATCTYCGSAQVVDAAVAKAVAAGPGSPAGSVPVQSTPVTGLAATAQPVAGYSPTDESTPPVDSPPISPAPPDQPTV
jgi:hypothetical protein